MKNHLYIFLVVLLSTVSAHAQLYVQPTAGPGSQDSYIYANDTFIFVAEDIELVENGATGNTPSIALRNKAQLLQGDDLATNKGNGEISIYQEGTTDNFDYNFWASPVGTAENAANVTTGDGNGGFSMIGGQEILKVPSTVLTSNIVLVNNNNLDGNISGGGGTATFNFASRWLYSYQSTTTTSGSTNASWSIVQNSTELPAGWGFSMKGVSGTDTTTAGEATPNNNNDFTDGEGQRYDFRGRPNNGTITGITVGENENSLVGNPYPSAFDLSYFLLENSGTGTFNTCDAVPVAINRTNVTDGIAYFWESDPDVNSHFLEDYQGGYGTFSPGGDICTDGMYVEATYLNYDDTGASEGNSGGSGDATLRRRFSPVGQGFFITGVAGQSTDVVNYNNNQRIYVPEGALNNSQFRDNEDESSPVAVAGLAVNRTYTDVTNLEKISQIKLAISVNDTYTRQLALGFIDNSTKGIDAAIDAENRSPLGTDISFDLEGALGTEKENGFVINGVPFDESQWVPLLIKAESISEFKFKVFETIDFPFSEVFLYDAQTDLYHDILHDEAFLILAEDFYTERFYIRFTKNTDNSEEEEEEEEETTEDEETEEDNETTDEEESEDEDTTDEDGGSEDESEDEDEDEDEDETSDDDEDTDSEDETSDDDEDTDSEDESEDEDEDTEDEDEDEDEDETNTDNDSENDDNTSDDDGTLSVEDQNPFVEESILESFIIVQNNLSRQLEISNPLNVKLNNLMIYDLTGKKVVNMINLENQSQYIVPTNKYATGVYVVQFITEDGLRKSRKISIVN